MNAQVFDEIRRLLLEDWDPIGINQYGEAVDEYDRYAPLVYDAVTKNWSEDELFQLLWSIETGHMGLDGDEVGTRRFAKKLMEFAKT